MSSKSGFNKIEPPSNYNVAMYFKNILIDEENDIIPSEQREKIKKGEKNNVYDENNLDEDIVHDYETIFGKENLSELEQQGTFNKLVFTESWYNKTRKYCRSENNTLEENRNKLKSYLLELLKCIIVVDILSMEKDNDHKNLIDESDNDNFENTIKDRLLNEGNTKRRLLFLASRYDGGDSGHRGKTQLVAQFCQKYLAYRLNDQKVSVDKDKNEELVDDSPDWVEKNRIAIILFVKCHIYRLMKHSEVETKCGSIQLSVSNNVTGNLLEYDDCIKNDGACKITSSQLADQLKETHEFEEYFLYAENGISLPSLGVDFSDFCKIIADYTFNGINKDENGVQYLRRTMGLKEFVELFIVWIKFDSQSKDGLENAHQKAKKYLYETNFNELNQRIEVINKYLSEKSKLQFDYVKKIIDEKTGQKIEDTRFPSEDMCKKSENNKSCENANTDKQIKIRWFTNIRFWQFSSLGATTLNFILLVVFINVWFYFIVPLVIFVFITLALFCYKPASENEVKENLKSSGDNSVDQYDSRSKTEKNQDLQKITTEKDEVMQ